MRVELQPFPHRRQPFVRRPVFLADGFEVVGEQAGVDNGIIGANEHVVGPPARRRVSVSDPGRGPFGVAGGHAGDDAHVAVLAGLVLAAGGRRSFELAERILQAEAVRPKNVVAGAAKRGRPHLKERNRLAMDLVGVDGGILAAGLEGAVLVGIRQHCVEDRASGRAVDRRLQVARLQMLTGADFGPPRLVDAVTNDAGDPLAQTRRPVHGTDGNRLIEGHADGGVAANTEVAVGAVGQLDDCVRKGVEHRAELRVGVRRHRPFAELALVAFGALLGRGEGIVVEAGRVRLINGRLRGFIPVHGGRRRLRCLGDVLRRGRRQPLRDDEAGQAGRPGRQGKPRPEAARIIGEARTRRSQRLATASSSSLRLPTTRIGSRPKRAWRPADVPNVEGGEPVRRSIARRSPSHLGTAYASASAYVFRVARRPWYTTTHAANRVAMPDIRAQTANQANSPSVTAPPRSKRRSAGLQAKAPWACPAAGFRCGSCGRSDDYHLWPGVGRSIAPRPKVDPTRAAYVTNPNYH